VWWVIEGVLKLMPFLVTPIMLGSERTHFLCKKFFGILGSESGGESSRVAGTQDRREFFYSALRDF
jgi:hypothetical protein